MHRTIGKALLVAFLLWHMFAVAAYSIPRDAKDDFAVLAHRKLIPLVSPYLFMTSQWQLWNIFAPDPLRRVTAYRVEVQEGRNWRTIDTVSPDMFSFFRHAARVKLMGNLLDEFSDNRAPFAGRYMQLLCMEQNIPTDTPIRLVYSYYVLPKPEKPQTMHWWAQQIPHWTDYTGFTTTCP